MMQEDSGAGVMKEPPVPCPERSGLWAKDHCDYLLDSIDAQLNQLQAWGSSAKLKDSKDNEMASLNRPKDASSPTGLAGCSVDRNVDASSEKDQFSLKEEYMQHLTHLLDLEGSPEDQSWSDSVHTEDFAAKFKEGLVEPLLNSDGEKEEVLAGITQSCVFGPIECTAKGQTENTGPSRLWEDPEAAAYSCSINTARKQPPKEEEPEQALTLGSGKPPSLVLQNRVRGREPLGGKILFCKEFSHEATSTTKDSSGSERVVLNRPLGLEKQLMGLKMGTALVGPQQRRDSLEDSSEQIQDSCENSISPLLAEDLIPARSLQTTRSAALRMTVLDAEASPRRVGQSCPEEEQHDCWRGLSSTACLCPVRTPCNSCMLVSGREVRGSSFSPCPLYPLIACDTGKRQRAAPSRPGTSTCVTNAPRDFQQLLGLGSEGSMKQHRTMNACTEKHHEALKLLAHGSLGVECCKSPYGLNSSCKGRSVAGHSTEKLCLMPTDLERDLGSSDADMEEKEEPELPSQTRGCRRWTPRGTESPGGKRPKRGAYGSCKASPGIVQHTADSSTETFLADLLKLEESIMKLQQDLKLEEETLLQKKSEIREADRTLRNALQEKKHVTMELETLYKTLEESRKEEKRLDLYLKQHRTKVEEARADLVLLECKRDSCLRQLTEVEKELSVLRQQCGQYGALQAEVSRLVAEREHFKSQVHQRNLQLRSCKAEVAAMQETAETRTEQLQEVVQAASKLDRRTQALERRVLALQKVLSEKELELSRLHKTVFTLEAEKERQDSAIESLRQEHKQQVETLQKEALLEKERELVWLEKEKQKQVQEVTERTEQAKFKALQEQEATFLKELENLRKTIKDQDAELVQQLEAMQQQARKLKQDAEEMVQKSLRQERKKWEADRGVALRMQQKTLEDQNRKVQAALQEALEKERRSGLALQAETDNLHKRIQELETQAQSLQGEKRTALEELRVVLQEEKAQALSQLRVELEQERDQERNRMRARGQPMDVEQRGASFREQGDPARPGRTGCALTREVILACQQLQHLLPKQDGLPSLSRILHGNSASLSSSQALQALREVSEETQHYLWDLKHETETLKHNILQIQREKEQELRRQQEQLRQESRSNLEALKDHLVQEHLKDIATLQRSWLKEKAMVEKHVLRKQLQEKDKELRAVQKDMACWKDETAHKLALQVQEQLDAELEQGLTKGRPRDVHRNQETTESGTGVPSCTSQIQALRDGNVLHSSLEDFSDLRGDLGTTSRNKRHLASDHSSTCLQGRSIRN